MRAKKLLVTLWIIGLMVLYACDASGREILCTLPTNRSGLPGNRAMERQNKGYKTLIWTTKTKNKAFYLHISKKSSTFAPDFEN
jgi:hypothetical protein